VLALKKAQDLSVKLSVLFPRILSTVCSDEPAQSLQGQQALAKQLARIFDFVLQFDEHKMLSPQLQNDFAFYRRNANKIPSGMKLPLLDEEMTGLSLYFATPTPMMNALTNSAKSLAKGSQVPNLLNVVISVCQSTVTKNLFPSKQTHTLCLRCMVASIVLFDHLDEKGAFNKKSAVNMKKCVIAIKTCPEATTSTTLINTLQYSTKHLNDADTPQATKDLFK